LALVLRVAVPALVYERGRKEIRPSLTEIH
jgi:hypothetical protein